MPARIFVSYRRDDVAGDAGRLTDHLQQRFGRRRVFLDIDSIDPGIDFVQALDASLRDTAAMLVVIGPRWTSLRSADGTRRLDAPDDFVVREVEAALGRGIPVVPVLVQGAALPTAAELPVSIAGLATRQTAVLDHSEFHDDVERLCDRLATMVGGDRWTRWRRWWPAVPLVMALIGGLIAYRALRTEDVAPPKSIAAAPVAAPAAATPPSEPSSSVPSIRDSTPVNATAKPRAARESPAVTAEPATSPTPTPGDLRREAEKVVLEREAAERARDAQAVDWIRNVRFETELGRPAFVETAKAALGVVDASLASATGTRRADLLVYSGWATYMLWRHASLTGMWGPPGARQPEPLQRYREALAIEPENPFANAMLAHWAFRRDRDLPGAHRLFDTALRTRREFGFVRSLQWSTFGTDFQPRDDVELVRVADDMRRHGERLSMGQAQTLYIPYSSATNLSANDKQRQALLDAVPPDDHIATLGWAFEDYVASSSDGSRRSTIRLIVALLHEKAGRTEQAVADLRALKEELPQRSSIQQSVEAALARLVTRSTRTR